MLIACLAALGSGLALATFGFGDEPQPAGKVQPDKAPIAAPAAPERIASTDQRAATAPPASDDSVRHHGALGVLLSQSADGVSIVGVIPGSPAEHADLRVGDEIRYIDDERIRTIQGLIETIGAYSPGTQVDVSIRRNGKRQIMETNLATRETLIGNTDRPKASPTARSGTPTAGDQPVNRGRGPNPPQSSPAGGKNLASEQQVSQRIRALERQIFHMEQELNALRYTQSTRARDAAEMRGWWEQLHHGETDNDPALFQ